jgi:hypothetical protein
MPDGAVPASPALGTRLERAAFTALCAITAVWALASLAWPLGWDQGVFESIGRVILDGGMPYRDAWDIKGPLTFYIYAASQLLFGYNTWGVRLLDLLLLGVAAAALFRVMRRLASPLAARWTALVFVLAVASQSFWDTAQPDLWVAHLTLVAFAPLLPRDATLSLRRCFVVGLAVGLGLLVKPIFLAFLLVPLVAIAIRRREGARPALRRLALLVLGCVLPVGAAALWFALHGALGQLIEVHLLYSARVYSGAFSPALRSRVLGLGAFAASGKTAAVALPAALTGAVVLWRARSKSLPPLLAWIAAGVGCIVLQNRFFDYHWSLVLPALAILSGVGLDAVAASVAASAAGPARTFARIFAVLIVLHAAAGPMREAARWVRFALGGATTEEYYDGFTNGTFNAAADLAAARHIEAHTRPGDRVAMWGWNAAIVYLSHRRHASRFSFNQPLVRGEESPLRQVYRDEYLAGMRARPPAYFVVANQTLIGGDTHDALEEFPELRRLVARDYRLDRRIGLLELYRRNAPPVAAP